jgi:hypothetical protein
LLSVTPIKGSNQYAAAHYFASGDDYYAKEHAGQWQGEGARLLGLTGHVEQAQLGIPEHRDRPFRAIVTEHSDRT